MSDLERDRDFFERNGIPRNARLVGLLPSRFRAVVAVGRVTNGFQGELTPEQQETRARNLEAMREHNERTSPGMFGYDSDSDDPDENPNAGIRLA